MKEKDVKRVIDLIKKYGDFIQTRHINGTLRYYDLTFEDGTVTVCDDSSKDIWTIIFNGRDYCIVDRLDYRTNFLGDCERRLSNILFELDRRESIVLEDPPDEDYQYN